MALNFNTELVKVADEFADFDLLKPKDQPGPDFQTQETDSMFILSVHLKGYRLMNIMVERNKDGSGITIRGEKPVQGMLMVGGRVVKKDIEMHGFRKSFKVPQGVVLARVKARFNEVDSQLIIRIPKAKKGFLGVGIEESNTKENPPESVETLHVYADGELSEQETEEENGQDIQKPKEQVENSNVESKEPELPKKRLNICTPVVFGSTFFVSLIVLVLHLVQSKKTAKQQKKTDED